MSLELEHLSGAYEPGLSIVRGEACRHTINGLWPEGWDPTGWAMIIDAENELVAIVPDRIGLTNPDRRLPEVLQAILEMASEEDSR